jgi:flavin reductase (DIM6/NTAB) family NADH-FMN oxidoreductase RutF
METDPNELNGYELYLTLGHVVTPRPVGWISTQSPDGQDNVAPYSFVTPIAVDPPVLVFQAAPHQDGTAKDTARNVIETGEFVYNVVTEELVEQMNESARHVDRSEFDLAGIERESAAEVTPPRVADAPAALECRLRETLDIEDTTVIFGDVERIVVDDDYLADGLVDVDRLEENVIGHIIDSEYTTLDRFQKEQPE